MVINIQWKKILRDSFMIKTMLKIHNNNIMEKSIINLFNTRISLCKNTVLKKILFNKN